MGFFNLIQKQHRIGTTSHRFRELSALLVPHITRRCADETSNGIPLHELAHVQPNQCLLLIEEKRRQRLGEFRLPDTGRAEKQKRSDRPSGVLHAGPGTPDRCRHGCHRLRLTDDALAEMGLEGEQLASLSSQKPLHRDPCPARHKVRNVTRFNLLAQQSRAGCLGLGLRRLEFLAPLLNGAQLVVLQPCRLLEVPLPFRLGNGMTQILILLKQESEFLQLSAFLLPAPAQILKS